MAASNPVTCYASAARTASPTAMNDQANRPGNHKGVHVVINISAVIVAPSTVFTLQGKDPLSGAYYTLLSSVALVGVQTIDLQYYPGLAAVVNRAASGHLPLIWRVIAVHGNANSQTYSVSATLLP